MNPSFSLDTQDCLSWLSAQKAGSFQLLVLDPPYNVGYRYGKAFRDRKPPHEYLYEQMLVLARAERLLKPGGSLWYLNYPETAAQVWARVDFLERFEMRPWIYHPHLQGFPLRKGSRQWLWFSKGKPLINREIFRGEYRNPEDPRIREKMEKGLRPVAYDWMEMEPVKNKSHQKRNHPCQLPEKMVEEIILGTTNPGDLVGDCYSGSGTTAICALRNGRGFSGCESEPGFVRVAEEAVFRELGIGNLVRAMPDQGKKDPFGKNVEIRRAI